MKTAPSSPAEHGPRPGRAVDADPVIEPGSDEEACDWFIRRRHVDWSAADEQQFQVWLAAAPLHRSRFADASATWEGLAGLARPSLASDSRAAAAAAPVEASPRRLGEVARNRPGPAGPWSRSADARPNRPHAPRRRRLLPAALAAGLAIAAVGWYGWNQTPGFAVELVTAAGETRQATLPDGSTVDLNFSSRLEVRYYRQRRDVILAAGEAFFDVAADPARPFSVDSGNSRVSVVGTRFNARAEANGLTVKVLEGRVDVVADRNSGNADRRTPVTLVANQALTVDGSRDAGGSPLRIVGFPAERIGDWRTGRLVFRRTPIGEVAREVGRYVGQPVVIDADPRLQALSVSGFADLRAPTTFLDALPDLLPVRVARAPDGSWRISAR